MIFPIERAAGGCHDSGIVDISDGERLVLRRKRLGWTQGDVMKATGLSRSAVGKVEKGKNVEKQTYDAVVDALTKAENEIALTQIGLDTPSSGRVGSPLHILRSSLETTRRPDLSRHSGEYQSDIPRGADAPESATETRIRELETLLSAEQAAHAEMRGVAAKLTDIIARRLEAIETRIAEASRGKRR